MILSRGLRKHLDSFLLACRCEDLSHRTIDDYAAKIGQVVDYLTAMGLTEPEEVTATHLRGFLLAKQARVKPASVQCYYRCAKRFFNWLVAEGILQSSPMKPIRMPRAEKTVIRPFTADELRDMLLVCEGRGILTLRDRAIILLFVDTGIRVSEMAGIQLGDVDVAKMQIKVMGKGRKERVVGLSPRTMMAIRKYVAERKDRCSALFVRADGHGRSTAAPLTVAGIYQVVKCLGRRAELTETRNSPHTFRHTFATMSLRSGASLTDIQNILGHETLAMTRRYSATLDSQDAAENQKRFSPVNNLKL